jgi:hypothetical protein
MAARTAVVAGTATAVSGNVQRRQQNRANDAQAQADADACCCWAAYASCWAWASASAGTADSDLLGQLNQLSQLHNAGVLSDTEFTAAKAKLLA